MSAFRVALRRSFVRIWVEVTVALPRIVSCPSITDSGAPTSSPNPTIVTSAPSIGISQRSSSSTIP